MRGDLRAVASTETQARSVDELAELFWSVMERSLLDATGTFTGADWSEKRKNRIRREAIDWIMDRGEPTEIGFTFEQICEHLGLHSERLRDGVIMAIENGHKWLRDDLKRMPQLVRMLRA